jgi:hypothetical protein
MIYYALGRDAGPKFTTMNSIRLLSDWFFTQIGGGEGTKDGEWLRVSTFPTTIHVELLKLKRIPDPVRFLVLGCYLKIHIGRLLVCWVERMENTMSV